MPQMLMAKSKKVTTAGPSTPAKGMWILLTEQTEKSEAAQARSVVLSRDTHNLAPQELPPLVLALAQDCKAWARRSAQQLQQVAKGEVEKDHKRPTARTNRTTIKKTTPKGRARLPRYPLLRGTSSRGLLNHSKMRESVREASSYGPCFLEPQQPRPRRIAGSRKMTNSKKPDQMDDEGPKHRAMSRVIGLREQLASTKTRSKKWKKKTTRTHPERSSGQSLARTRRSQTTTVTSNPRLVVIILQVNSKVERNPESRQCGQLSQKRAKVGRIAEVVNEVGSKIARKDRA